MPPIASAIVQTIIFRFTDRGPEYLVLRRAPDEPLYPRMWQIVTGTIRDGETAVAAALREVGEETGLEPLHCWVVPYTPSFYDQMHDAIQVCPLFAVQVSAGVEPRLSAEHADHCWCSYPDALSRLVWPGQRTGLEITHKYVVSGEAASRLTFLK